jgi:hypothetical protein
MEGTEEHDVEWTRVWRYRRDNQDPHIEEEQTTQFILLLVLTNSFNLFCHLKNVGLHYHVICQCVFFFTTTAYQLSTQHWEARAKNCCLGIRITLSQRHVYMRTVVVVNLHYTNSTKRVGLVRSRYYHHIIECK